ncbi:MAG: hypothetical protein ABIG30_03875 [Candidatus Aenigmatarchaeota archaeon]
MKGKKGILTTMPALLVTIIFVALVALIIVTVVLPALSGAKTAGGNIFAKFASLIFGGS